MPLQLDIFVALWHLYNPSASNDPTPPSPKARWSVVTTALRFRVSLSLHAKVEQAVTEEPFRANESLR